MKFVKFILDIIELITIILDIIFNMTLYIIIYLLFNKWYGVNYIWYLSIGIISQKFIDYRDKLKL